MTGQLLAAEQQSLWNAPGSKIQQEECPQYLSEQIITYIGNKRSLLPLIGKALTYVQKRTGKEKLRIFDAFAGSGIVSRFCKQYASFLVSNDLELYAETIGSCYLSNASELDVRSLRESHCFLLAHADRCDIGPGIIRQLYSPRSDTDIHPNERVFYTSRNAELIDNFRRAIGSLPEWQHRYFLAPLLCEASVHANTSGVFKGFYKNSKTGAGQFGGNGQNALKRILGKITLPFPVFSRFDVPWEMHRDDANALAGTLRNFDVAYFDPPYNQHPYGSNYFMLNLIIEYQKPERVSKVSGIPQHWNRSSYNKPQSAASALHDLFENTDASFVLLSYNNEGFVTRGEIERMMTRYGKVLTFEQPYTTFRGCRNLHNRTVSVTEHLFLVERR